MKRRLKSIALCCAAGILALAGGVSVRSAVAAGNEMQVGANYAVDLKNATAKIATKSYGDKNVEGLYVESNSAYSGSFRKVFTDDLTLEYRFPGERVKAAELFTFTVTSVKTSDSFKIVYRELGTSGGRTQMYVSYTLGDKEVYRSNTTFAAHKNKSVSDIGIGSVGQINGNIGDDLGEKTTNQMFSIELVDDVVNVYGKLGLERRNDDKVLLCSFDGTVNDEILPDDPSLSEEENQAAETEAYKNRWSLSYDANEDTTANKDAFVAAQNKFFMPKIDFSEGYTVDFSSSYGNGVDVLFLNYALGDDTSGNAFADMEASITVTDQKVYNGKTEVKPGAYIGVPQYATDWNLYSETKLSVAEGQWIDAGTYVSTADVPFVSGIDTSKLGVYETDLDGLLAGNITVAVIEPVDPLSVLGTISGASVTGDYTQYKLSDATQANYTGIAIETNDGESEWNGSFNGIFYGDVQLGFRFMGDAGEGKNGNASGEFTFKVIDATDSNNYFWVSYRSVIIGSNSFATVGVKEGGDRPIATENMFTYHLFGYTNVTPNGNGHPANGHFFPSFNSDRIETADAMNVLSFKNTTKEGMMSVAASMGKGTAAATLHSVNDIGKFDGETTANQGGGLSPLSKMYFPNGYRVEFSTTNATDICFISINGESLSQKLSGTADTKELDMKAEFSKDGTTKVEIPLYSATHGFTVTERVNVCGVLNTIVNRIPAFSKSIDLSVMMSEEPITISYGGRISKVYQITIGGPATRGEWKEGIAEVMDYNVGTGVSVPTPSANDLLSLEERLQDGSYTTLDLTTVWIKVIEPGASTEKDVKDVQFVLPGNYTVIYYAPSASMAGGSISVQRIISVINESIPVFNFTGDKVLTGYVGETIVIPTATATAEGADLEVNVIVSVDGEIIANGKDITSFKPNKAGEYFVSYSAVSPSGKSNSNGYTVKVLLDEVGPTIYVEFSDKTVAPGTMVNLPDNVTATDNVDGDVEVTVSITFGTENVEFVGNRFYAEFLGVYKVTYRAVDAKGNQTLKEFYITVGDGNAPSGTPDSPNKPGNSGGSGNVYGCGAGCSGDVTSIFGGIAVISVLMIMLVIVKKKEGV